MIELTGQYGTARCYAEVIEPEAVDQILKMLDMPFAAGQSIAIMPDAHAGAGCTIGTTMTVTDAICPNLVGVDIGCGMYVVRLEEDDVDLAALDAACYAVPSGFDVWDTPRASFALDSLTCIKSLKKIDRIHRSIGTLGGGNHFIELERDDAGSLYLIIHSGSRNLGLQVAKLHQSIAVSLHCDAKRAADRAKFIDTYKRAGRQSEIEAALRNFVADVPVVPDELAWLYGEKMDDYINDVAICQQFAQLNRETIADAICASLKLTPVDAFHTIHNYVDVDEMVLRKGATSAKLGERVLIPLNMRDGSVLAYGRGNADWNMSGPHGAGRVMSRSAARKSLSLADFESEMSSVYTTSVCESTLDEAPDAYKSKADILGPIAESVEIERVLAPVYNFKAH